MALLTKFHLDVYFENKFFDSQKYLNILTTDQITEIGTPIKKTFEFKNSYARIGTFEGDKESIRFRVDFYDNQEKENLIESRNYIIEPILESEDNFIKQCYEYLKTLPEFENAINF